MLYLLFLGVRLDSHVALGLRWLEKEINELKEDQHQHEPHQEIPIRTNHASSPRGRERVLLGNLCAKWKD